MPDGPRQKTRDEALGKAKQSLLQQLSGEKEFVILTPDMEKPFPHPDLVIWLYGYDATTQVKKYLVNSSSALSDLPEPHTWDRDCVTMVDSWDYDIDKRTIQSV